MRNEMQIKNEIGQNIKYLLSKNNCSQQELAKALGTDKSTVSNWVRGKRIPRLDLVDRMCVIFGCTRNDVLSNNEKITIEDILRNYIKEKYGNLNAFFKTINLPPSTLYTILERGINNSSFANIMKITSALNISADALANGRIEEKLTKIEFDKLTTVNRIKLTDYFNLLYKSQ